MTADMLTAYYSRGCDSKSLFSDLKISQTDNFLNHLNKYNVIYLPMADYTDKQSLNKITKAIKAEALAEYPNMTFVDGDDLSSILYDIFSVSETSFVFVIDDFDCPLSKGDKQEQLAYLYFLNSVLKDKPYVALVYMTGLLPIKHIVNHATLNMFMQYSMENQRTLAEFTGFTEEEVENLCNKYNKDIDVVKMRYRGYNLRGVYIYPPQSIVCAMLGEFDESWAKVATEELRKYISLNFDGLQEKVISMIGGSSVKVDTTTFLNDMVNLHSADDVLTLLIHLGYLTYDYGNKTCKIPNKELEELFICCLRNKGGC